VDGTVPTSGVVSNNIVGAELSQYSGFLSASDLLVATSIDNIVEHMSDQLGYQAGLTVDRISRDAMDAFSSSVTVSLFGSYPTAQDIRGGVAILQGIDALPFEHGDYEFICHPYSWFDIINDPAANGYADIFKHTTTNTAMKDNANVRKDSVARFAGVRVRTTTNVKVTTGSPNTYRSYLFAKNGWGCASLEGWKPSDVRDPNTQKFKIDVIPGGRPDKADPTGEIGGMVSYKFAYVVVCLDGPDGIGGNFRYRVWENPTLLGL
jgi:N4-gp56 family major capsid protein